MQRVRGGYGLSGKIATKILSGAYAGAMFFARCRSSQLAEPRVRKAALTSDGAGVGEASGESDDCPRALTGVEAGAFEFERGGGDGAGGRGRAWAGRW